MIAFVWLLSAKIKSAMYFTFSRVRTAIAELYPGIMSWVPLGFNREV
jgi:hypothetical protein